MNWWNELIFFHADTDLGKGKSCFNNYWVGMVKNKWGLIDHETLKSSLSHKWFDELSILVEWFLHADSDGIIFGLIASPIYVVI